MCREEFLFWSSLFGVQGWPGLHNEILRFDQNREGPGKEVEEEKEKKIGNFNNNINQLRFPEHYIQQ